MGHCIRAIVAPALAAESISRIWPELPRLSCENGFAVFPVDAALIDQRIAPDKTPTVTGDEFMLLTNGFRELLCAMSIGGELAYVETEYFGGTGGQGALVYRDGDESMPPTWRETGIINVALKMIGLKRSIFVDEFETAGFGLVRRNDDIIELIESQTT